MSLVQLQNKVADTEKVYELIIVGGGPGGLSAGLYAARARLDALLVEKGASGGQILVTDWIENYPGFEGLTGFDLADKMAAHANKFGMKTLSAHVTSMDLSGGIKKLTLDNGKILQSKAVIIGTGARPTKLRVPGVLELIGKGVSYCATCDGPFFRDLDVAVVGGGETAVQEAVFLTKFAKSVTIIHRRDELRASKIIQERAFKNDKIKFLYDSQVAAVEGENEVEALRIKNNDGSEKVVPFQGVFILIGIRPNSEDLPLDQLESDDGFLVTDCNMKTNIAGVTAVGDVRADSIRQVVSAAGDGAVALKTTEHYLDNL
jgi:thioredoxin reductase (NADPH)